MPFQTRYEIRAAGLFRNKTRVVLCVKDNTNGRWRDATRTDLSNMERRTRAECERISRCSMLFFPTGMRVDTIPTGFASDQFAESFTVQFQEPNTGKVWVIRDGAKAPFQMYADELRYSSGVFTKPVKKALTDVRKGTTDDFWWIASGRQFPNYLRAGDTALWLEENGIDREDYSMQVYGDIDHTSEAIIPLIGFRHEADATLFYMRFV